MTLHDLPAAYATFESHLDAVGLLRQQVRQCHKDLDASAADWLQEARSSAAWSTPVRLYVHALCVEDSTVQSVLREDPQLFTSLLTDLGGPADALRQYARAVYASTDAYLSELSPDGLSQVVDLYKLGVGRRTVGWVIRRFVVVELARIGCEIAAATAPSTATRRRITYGRSPQH